MITVLDVMLLKAFVNAELDSAIWSISNLGFYKYETTRLATLNVIYKLLTMVGYSVGALSKYSRERLRSLNGSWLGSVWIRRYRFML